MAAVIGPNSYVTGQVLQCKVGDTCDTCANEGITKQATHAVVGETDSLGSEVGHYCTPHYHKVMAEIAESRKTVTCERCDGTEEVRPTRDPEEGMRGPQYMLCKTCRSAMLEYLNQFLDDEEEY